MVQSLRALDLRGEKDTGSSPDFLVALLSVSIVTYDHSLLFCLVYYFYTCLITHAPIQNKGQQRLVSYLTCLLKFSKVNNNRCITVSLLSSRI